MNPSHRIDALAQIGLFLICTVLFAWVGVRDTLNGLLSDSYVYLAAASALRDDTGLLRHIATAYPFPPLFPAVLALAGAGSTSAVRSYMVCAVLLAAVVSLMLRWLRAEQVPPIAATAAAVAFAALPLSLQSAMGVLSEPLFMGLLLATMLALPTRSTPIRRVSRAWMWAALCVALASLTRSVGVAAIAAFMAHWLFMRGWRVSRVAPLVALAPFAAWSLLKKLGAWHDYPVGALAERDPWRMLQINLDAWQLYAVKAVDLSMKSSTTHVLAALGVMMALVWLYRLARGRFDAWFVAAYLVIMAVWPYPHHAARFLFVLLPFAIGYPAIGLAASLARLHAPSLAGRVVPAVPPAVLLILSLPSSAAMLAPLWQHRGDLLAVAMRAPAWYQASPSAALRSARFEARLVEFQRTQLARVPDDACVASVIPQQVLVYGPRRGLDLTQVQALGSTLEVALAQCPYVLMIAARPYPPVAGIGSLYPLDEIRARMDVIAFERDRPDDASSALVAMLAKVK